MLLQDPTEMCWTLSDLLPVIPMREDRYSAYALVPSLCIFLPDGKRDPEDAYLGLVRQPMNHSFDGRSFSGSRSYRTSATQETLEQPVCKDRSRRSGGK